MNATSKDIATILEGISSLGLTFGVNLFIGREPTTPSNCVTIYDTPGMPPQLNLTDQGYEYPAVQIRVRDIKYQDGWDLISAINKELHGLSYEITESGAEATYTAIYCAMNPFLLDWDENSRARFVSNYNLQRHA